MRAASMSVLAVLSSVTVLSGALRVQGDPLREALALGRTHDEALFQSFERSYSLSPSGTIDSAGIVTEFRRAVLLVRDHTVLGDYAFGPADLTKALAPFRGLVAIIVQVRLSPLNVFIKMPPY